MGAATGTIEIHQGSGSREVYAWNGNPEDRAQARAAFEAAMKRGSVFAAAVVSPGRATQVRTFEQIEDIERTQGQVTVQVNPALRGG